MDTFLAIASRRDERRTRREPLPDAVVERILDAGRLSGSSRNGQPWTFVVPASAARVASIAESVFVPENVLDAGLVVAILVSGKGPTRFDAGRATQSMLLAAWNDGIASCPNGIADQECARRATDATPGEEVAIVLTFGLPEHPRDPMARTPEEWSARANRRALGDVVRRVG
jgi:nitroreductase